MIESMVQLLAQNTVNTVPMAPAAIMALCVVAGVGTVFLLPSRREAPLRKIGAVVLLTAALIFAALLARWAAGIGGMGVYFWIFAAIALFGAVRVITHTRPVYSALYFVLTVFASAGLFLLMWAEFMAAALILIYAGAILITYVFVIMLAAEATPEKTGALSGLAEADAVSRDPVLASAIGFALMGVLLFLIFDKYQGIEVLGHATTANSGSANVASDQGSTQQLGTYLFTNQLINLELAGLILTVAMVGAIVIARRQIYKPNVESSEFEQGGDVVIGPATPLDDSPHSIPVYGTSNPRQKAYPET